MAPYYPPPDTNKLLHPLLACLPLAFISSQPPPALLPILSPILRQRVKLLSETRSRSEGSWLPLLCWESADAANLPSIVENMSFEAHPVSGELEFGEIERSRYRRLDEETLQARSELTDVSLVVIYTWCTNDTEGGEDGWRISEFKPLKEPPNDGTRPWYTTFSEADEKYKTDAHDVSRTIQNGNGHAAGGSTAQEPEEEDDAYWSQYDQRQSETPGQASTPAPQPNRGASHTTGNQTEDDDYYSRYDSVQPEMDAEDPSEDSQAVGDSSLPGNILLNRQITETVPEADRDQIVHTRPSSSSSSVVAQLEQSAEHQSQSEVAIQQHISSSIKGLYRLAKGASIQSSEFRRLVLNELECLSLMDEDD